MFLLFAVFLVNCRASPLHHSSVEPSFSGSDVINLAQVITTLYCFIDDCTFSRINTGQKLDIIYTTENVIVVTPRGNETTVVLAKLQTTSPCSTSRSTISAIQFTMLITLSTLIVIVSGYNAFVYLVLKQLRNPFEKLMLLFHNNSVCHLYLLAAEDSHDSNEFITYILCYNNSIHDTVHHH